MKRFTLILSLMVAMVTTAMAGDIVASTNEASPENVFTMVNGNGASVGADAAPGDGRFAFFAVDGVENAYYIYSVDNGKWFSYAKADSYNVGTNFVTLSDVKENYFHFEKCTNKSGVEGYYQIRPYNNSGVAGKYLNYYGGVSDGVKLGLWTDSGSNDNGSCYMIEEYEEVITVNTLEGFNPNKCYTITTSNRGGWTVTDDLTAFQTTGYAGQAVDKTNTKQHFAVLSADGENYYLFNVAANKFVKQDRSLVAGGADAIVLHDASTLGAGRVMIQFKGMDNGYVNIGGNGDPAINNYGAAANQLDAGNAVLFTEVGDFDPTEALAMLSNVAEVTYNFVCNSVTLATQTSTVAKGEEFPAFNVTLPLGYEITEQKPDGTVAAATVEEITVVVNNALLPFNAVAEGTPTTWYYAQMHAYTSGGYNYRWFIAPAEDGTSIRTQDHEFAANETDSHLWGFVGTVEGGFKMVNKGSGEAIKSENGGVATMAAVAEATAFIAMGSQIGADWFCMKNPAGNYLNSQGSVANANNCDFVIKHWTDNDGGSSFYLTEYVDEDVTVTVSDAGWATMYLDEAVHVPAGVNAYIVTGVENDYLIKEQIAEGEAIPANTGILLENKGEYNFAKTVTYNVTFATNLLAGTLTDTEIAKEEGNSYYILANGEDGIGFYNPVLGEDATKFNNAANKAYLVVPESVAPEAASYSFRFGEGTTGISEVKGESGNVKVIYDLTGRRVENPSNGIYIINGVKVLVK